jgi:hypothetical protein
VQDCDERDEQNCPPEQRQPEGCEQSSAHRKPISAWLRLPTYCVILVGNIVFDHFCRAMVLPLLQNVSESPKRQQRSLGIFHSFIADLLL